MRSSWCVVFSLLLIFLANESSAVHWQKSGKIYWSFACDWHGWFEQPSRLKLRSAKAPSNLCGPICLWTDGCTHFTFTKYDGGTCWLKGSLNWTKHLHSYVKETHDYSMICGYKNPYE